MDNQHKKIKGYRDLSQAEIDLMNKIKTHGVVFGELVKDVRDTLKTQRLASHMLEDPASRADEQLRLDQAEPERWASVARTHFQEGLMALTRSIAQPGFF